MARPRRLVNRFLGAEVEPIVRLRVSSRRLPRPRGLRDLVANERNLVVAQPLLVEPVGTGDFLERMDRRLNAFRPRHRNQLDVAMYVADGEEASAARFEVRIDRDAAVFVEPDMQSLEGFPGPQEADLHDDDSAVEGLAVGQREANLKCDVSSLHTRDFRLQTYRTGSQVYRARDVRLNHDVTRLR